MQHSYSHLVQYTHCRNSCMYCWQQQQVIVLFISSLYICSQLSEACLPLHNTVRKKLADLFQSGLRRVNAFTTMIADYVDNDLFAGCPPPPLTDARFRPSNRCILGYIARLSSKSRFLSPVAEAVNACISFHLQCCALLTLFICRYACSYQYGHPATVDTV